MSDEPTGSPSPEDGEGAALVISQDRDGVLLLTVSASQVDDKNADGLGLQLEQAASALPQPRVVLNLERIEYLSSAALGVFIAFRQKLDREGGKLRLCGLQPKIVQVFRLTKLNRAFDIRGDLEGALTDF